SPPYIESTFCLTFGCRGTNDNDSHRTRNYGKYCKPYDMSNFEMCSNFYEATAVHRFETWLQALYVLLDICPEKFASNVSEFCLSKCGEAYQKQMFDALLYGYNKRDSNKPALISYLIRNEYGNYVIQTMAEVSMCGEHKNYRDNLIEQIQTNVFKTDLIKYITRRIDQLHEYANTQRQAKKETIKKTHWPLFHFFL
ncbi:hypothetical protein RFI_22414, partial [Reticulomyxa filosa]